jgi:hypothetical protein
MLFTEITVLYEVPIELIKLCWPNADKHVLRSMKVSNHGGVRDLGRW